MKSIVSKLLPDQIAAFWDVIKYGIEQSLPPITYDHPDKMNRILSAALSGRIDVWAEYVRDETERARFEGIVLTCKLYDEPSGTKNMLVYCVYGYNPVDSGSWARTMRVIAKYAKEKGCSQLIAYTSVPKVISICKELGANTDYTFVSFDVNETVKKLNGLGG